MIIHNMDRKTCILINLSISMHCQFDKLITRLIKDTHFICVEITTRNYLVTVSKNQWNFICLKWFIVLEEYLRGKRLKYWFVNADCTVLHRQNHVTMNSEHLTVMFAKDKMTLLHAFKCHLNSITTQTKPVYFYNITMINVDQFQNFSASFLHILSWLNFLFQVKFFCCTTLLSASSSQTEAMGTVPPLALIIINAPSPFFFWNFPLPLSNNQ